MKRVSIILMGLFLWCMFAEVGHAQTFFTTRPGDPTVQYQDKTRVPGTAFYVDSGHVSASDITARGFSPDTPFATLDYAVGQCTDNAGDVIFVAPGHYEDIAAAETVDLDVAGITVIGLTDGSTAPTFVFDGITAGFDIGANNVTIRNLKFQPSVATVTIGVDVEASATGVIIEDCEFMVGEAGNGTDEFVTVIDVKSANHNSIIRNNIFRTHASVNGSVAGILLTAASSRVTIADNVFTGVWSTAAIDDGAACTDVLIRDNVIKGKDGEPGIELTATTTGVIYNNQIESTGLADPDAAIVAADCSWFHNYVVTADGTAQQLIGTDTTQASAGTDFLLTCVLNQASVVAGGVDVTEASSGGIIYVVDVIVQNGATVFDSGGDAAVFEMYSDNGDGAGSFYVTTEASLAVVGKPLDLSSAATTGTRVVLETGKKILVKATTEDFTSDGLFTIYIILRRGAAGATATAGATCL